MSKNRTHFASLGMFIIDQFEFLNAEGKKTGKELEPQVMDVVSILHFRALKYKGLQIGGGGVYAAIGARIWYEFSVQCHLPKPVIDFVFLSRPT